MKKTPRKIYIKYNSDDILEILSESIAVEKGFGTFSSKGLLLVDKNDVRYIAVIGELDDPTIEDTNLYELDLEMKYNGTHNDNYQDISIEAAQMALDKISRGTHRKKCIMKIKKYNKKHTQN